MDVNVDCDENIFRNLNTFLREFPQRNRAKQMTTTILALRTRFELGVSKPQKYFMYQMPLLIILKCFVSKFSNFTMANVLYLGLFLILLAWYGGLLNIFKRQTMTYDTLF